MIEQIISRRLQIPLHQVQGTVRLLREGATIPFISRYRKEATGSLDEVQVASVKEWLDRLTELEKYSLENPFLHPVEDYPNRYDILFNERDKGTSVVQFKVGSHMIDMNIPGNKELLNAVGKAFRLILDDPNASLKQIVIAGYASPEGSLAFNTALAQKRAENFGRGGFCTFPEKNFCDWIRNSAVDSFKNG